MKPYYKVCPLCGARFRASAHTRNLSNKNFEHLMRHMHTQPCKERALSNRIQGFAESEADDAEELGYALVGRRYGPWLDEAGVPTEFFHTNPRDFDFRDNAHDDDAIVPALQLYAPRWAALIAACVAVDGRHRRALLALGEAACSHAHEMLSMVAALGGENKQNRVASKIVREWPNGQDAAP